MERPPMRKKFRRFEVLLPARFNDGREAPDDLVGDAIDEVIDQFHAASYYKDAAEGVRHLSGQLLSFEDYRGRGDASQPVN